MSAPRRILLVDADAFFVAVARMVDPAGAGRAPLLIVGGDPKGRGVVCSASYEARRFGVRSAMPMARAVRLCPAATVVPVPRRACGQKSGEIRRALERFAPVVESASIDEWYLDLAGTETLYHGEPLAATARRIRTAVQETTGLSVSIGGGTTKLIAKLAAERAKPGPGRDGTGVLVVEPGGEGEFMRSVRLGEIPLLGPKAQQRLERFGLRTAEDVMLHETATLAGWLGDREALWLRDRVRGIDPSEVSTRDEPKSISREDTFAQDVVGDAPLERELLRLVVRAASELRGEGMTARTITVKLRDADFRTRRASRTLPEAVVSDRVIYVVAKELLRKLRAARRVHARLLGVSLTSLSGAPTGGQLPLFAAQPSPVTETERDRVVARVVDALRARFGPDAIVPAKLAAPEDE